MSVYYNKLDENKPNNFNTFNRALDLRLTITELLLIDFSKFFDNIRHDIIIKILQDKIGDSDALNIVIDIIQLFKIDVSYMNVLFNSLEYDKIEEIYKSRRDSLKTVKYSKRSVNILDTIYNKKFIENWYKNKIRL